MRKGLNTADKAVRSGIQYINDFLKLWKNRLFIKSIQAIIMLTIFSKAFGVASAQESIKLKPRQINLSGDILSFSMPENFSVDMPAENMIESADLMDKSIFKDYRKFTLIRRWWDFKNKGFFGKEYGTIMMSIYIKQISENSEYDILNPLGFIGTIIKGFNELSENGVVKNSNGETSTLYPNFYEAYLIKTINSLHWFRYMVDKRSTGGFDLNYAIPITPQHHILVTFSVAPNIKISARQFFDAYGRSFTDNIMETFFIRFTNKNNMQEINSRPFDLGKLVADKFHSEDEVKFIGFE